MGFPREAAACAALPQALAANIPVEVKEGQQIHNKLVFDVINEQLLLLQVG
jgi:hypothetical protein